MTPAPFKLRVYYGDTDAGGVVYHARYLEFFERARYEYLAALGLDAAELANQGIVFAVVSMQVDFKQPARLGENLEVSTAIKELGRASILVAHEVKRSGFILCRAQVKLACVNKELKLFPLPERLRSTFAGAPTDS